MTTRAVERVDEWPSESFPGGYAALHDLADDEFSGIVQVGRARLCMLGGTVVGILDGDIGDFEHDGGTSYAAPSPALPLLALMQERNDEVKAKYYTEDTPISEIDDTLSDGNFSGYIELSENVLSGDYYLVYHAGRSMAVAFVGNSAQLLTDDEAFDRTAGEVGIYQVRPAEVDPIDIPVVESAADSADAQSGTAAAATTTTDDDASAEEPTDDEPAVAEATDSESADDTQNASADDATTTETADDATAPGTADDAADHADGTSETSADAAEPTGRTEGTATPSTEADEATTSEDSAADEPRASDSDDTARSGASETADRGSTARSEDAERRDAATGGDANGATGSESARTTDDERPSSASARESARTGDESAGGTRKRSEETRDAERARRRDPSNDRNSGTQSANQSQSGRDERAGTGTTGRRPTDDSRSEGAGGAHSGGVSGPDQLETRAVPSLDPSRSSSQPDAPPVDPAAGRGGPGPTGGGPGTETESDRRTPTSESSARPESESGRRKDAHGATEPTEPAESPASEPAGREAQSRETAETNDRAAGGAGATRSEQPGDGVRADRGGESTPAADERVAELEDELATVEDELADVEEELTAVETERDELADERETLRSERDRLREARDELRTERDELERERDELQAEVDDMTEELDRMESQLEQLEAQHGAAPDAEKRLTPTEALDQTNLFIRYESKGRATLETAHDGNASKQEVNENLGLEYHTQFDAATASVSGQTFDAFLTDTIQYRFVTWVINNLLYEIRDTGKIAAMQDLYDAIPRIDRAELNGTINAEFAEDGQERRAQESFDVVLRDRMGNPLLVANLNDSRQAATENMMSSLITASTHVGQSEETLSAAFLVTSSFFEPEALESASEATSGGLLSRDKRESFVKLARKQGFHLCLVEAREGKFHLAVPEL